MIFAMSCTAFIKPKVCIPENNLCRGPIPVSSPQQHASAPELSLKGEGPLSTIPVPVVIVACLLRRGLASIHLELQVRKDTCKLHSQA